MLPLLNASWKPIYLRKRIAASSLFSFYCLEESDIQFFVSLFLPVNYYMQIHWHVIFFIYCNIHHYVLL